MARPRSKLINLSDTHYYHCISRCVRQAYLCGKDKKTGKNYEHRRGWVENRLLLLADIFCIGLCAYAVMSNHTHVVLRVDKSRSQKLSDIDVAVKWMRLFKGSILLQQFINPHSRACMSKVERDQVRSEIQVYRGRLADVSWFMRCLNEYIARKANKEDECKGRFWEGRFTSQALLDEKAVLACMTYVDLNPVRAGLATSLESSKHTSIRRRILALMKKGKLKSLMPFTAEHGSKKSEGIPFEIYTYIKLVEITGKIKRPDKPGFIKSPSLFEEWGISPSHWIALTSKFEVAYKGKIRGDNFCASMPKAS
ncbi:transposase [Aestuariibacter sp. AA17]|uniref:Transposase n=1 Tax=Fluctibacter corallii TaxID=2984329 RepID=A0ABT3A598_9ALTE|nr:transposase [Aestuariibacter sp. AA17]MCV2883798.1 transposase [Aestuariibacter sp. AA17]